MAIDRLSLRSNSIDEWPKLHYMVCPDILLPFIIWSIVVVKVHVDTRGGANLNLEPDTRSVPFEFYPTADTCTDLWKIRPPPHKIDKNFKRQIERLLAYGHGTVTVPIGLQ